LFNFGKKQQGKSFLQKMKNMDGAVVTGGAQGIGRAIAQKLMGQGIFVFVVDHDLDALDDFREECGVEGLFEILHCDVGDAFALEGAMKQAAQRPGGIRYLVNNAAISEFKPLEQLDLDTWNRVLAVNLTSYLLTVKYLAGTLKANKGAVVNLCSTRGFMSEPHTEAYSTSKGGVFALTHALAMSLQPHVRVNSISPGWIDVTDWQKKNHRKHINWDEKHHKQHPAGRIGRPEDIADLAWYLLSEQAGFITGQNFTVDGGMTRKMIYESE
jgi:NAD(P)-dependent dehydrogenase (short-subunit alcohol dehydrogenase family)